MLFGLATFPNMKSVFYKKEAGAWSVQELMGIKCSAHRAKTLATLEAAKSFS